MSNPVIKSWHITKFCKGEGADAKTHYQLYGNVFGHPSSYCPDGMYIHTSSIQNIRYIGNNIIEAQTRNTVYHVSIHDFGTLADLEDASAGVDFTMSHGDFTVEVLRDIFKIPEDRIEAMLKSREERFHARKGIIDACKGKLELGQIYLALSAEADYYFDYGVARIADEPDSSDTILELTKSVHVGIHQDSVLIRADSHFNILARYFPYQTNNLSFYDSFYQDPDAKPDGVKLGYLKNTGTIPLNIGFTWGKYITLAPDEEIEVIAGVTGGTEKTLTNEADMHPAVELPNDSNLRIVEILENANVDTAEETEE